MCMSNFNKPLLQTILLKKKQVELKLWFYCCYFGLKFIAKLRLVLRRNIIKATGVEILCEAIETFNIN